jgi:hypothetical protein
MLSRSLFFRRGYQLISIETLGPVLGALGGISWQIAQTRRAQVDDVLKLMGKVDLLDQRLTRITEQVAQHLIGEVK